MNIKMTTVLGAAAGALLALAIWNLFLKSFVENLSKKDFDAVNDY